MSDEAPRDQADSGFTPLLRALLADRDDILAAAFIDKEGECVDYCSRIDPFEAKVAGAHMQIVTASLRSSISVLGGGELMALEVWGDERELVSRRVDDHYLIVLVVRAGGSDERLFESLEGTIAALRREAGLATASWDPQAGPLEVVTRGAVGWAYAPSAFRQGAHRVEIAAVLGRWVERGRAAGGMLECFRVRTQGGVELTLADDRALDRWLRW